MWESRLEGDGVTDSMRRSLQATNPFIGTTERELPSQRPVVTRRVDDETRPLDSLQRDVGFQQVSVP